MHPTNQPAMQAARVAAPRVWTGLVLNGNYAIGSLNEQCSTFELYEGTEITTGDRVSLKILLPELATEPKTLALFLDEMQMMERVSHPGLLRYRACASDPQSGLAYVVMDSPGPRLSARLHLLKPTADGILAFSRRLASALASVHRAGLVHGRLSPASVVLSDSRLEDAVITGFSSIRTDSSSAFDRASINARYLAPEQRGRDAEDDVAPSADVYSLALIILAMANGKDGSLDASHLPRKLRPIVTRMLRVNPRHRFRSMEDVAELLDNVVLDSGATWGRLSVRPAPGVRRAGLAAAALLIAATPWLLQTSWPQTAGDARAASGTARVETSLPADLGALPQPPTADVFNVDETPAAIAIPEAKPGRAPARNRPARPKNDRQERANEITDTEADQTARLNAGQAQRANDSPVVAAAIPRDDLAVIEPRPTNALDVNVQPTDNSTPSGRDGENVPLSPSPSAELTALDGARPIDENTPAAPAISPPASEPAIASASPEQRAKANADRRLREWCKAQRRRCTFPTPGS
jgi:hypothetical protein